MKLKNLTGEVFGLWSVIRYLGKRMWLCRCQCGIEKPVLGDNLRAGVSLGCRDCRSGGRHTLPNGQAALNDLYGRYMRSAIERGYSWDLDFDAAKNLFQSDCDYCGAIPSKIWGGHLNGGFVYNGIDRVDSSFGYTPGNCVPCCTTCNYMKRSLSRTQFFEHIRRIVGRIRVEKL